MPPSAIGRTADWSSICRFVKRLPPRTCGKLALNACLRYAMGLRIFRRAAATIAKPQTFRRTWAEFIMTPGTGNPRSLTTLDWLPVTFSQILKFVRLKFKRKARCKLSVLRRLERFLSKSKQSQCNQGLRLFSFFRFRRFIVLVG
jgi:hypothetical protein